MPISQRYLRKWSEKLVKAIRRITPKEGKNIKVRQEANGAVISLPAVSGGGGSPICYRGMFKASLARNDNDEPVIQIRDGLFPDNEIAGYCQMSAYMYQINKWTSGPIPNGTRYVVLKSEWDTNTDDVAIPYFELVTGSDFELYWHFWKTFAIICEVYKSGDTIRLTQNSYGPVHMDMYIKAGQNPPEE